MPTFLIVEDIQTLFRDERAVLVGRKCAEIPEKGQWMDLAVDDVVRQRLECGGLALSHGEKTFVACETKIELTAAEVKSQSVTLRTLTEAARAAVDFQRAHPTAMWVLHYGKIPILIDQGARREIPSDIDQSALAEHLKLLDVPVIEKIRKV